MDYQQIRCYYLTDHLGSTRAVVDDAGTVLETFDYYPFGLLMPQRNTAGPNTIEKFTGKERDSEIGLDYFGARYYDPALARWHSVDQLADDYPGWSPYNYTVGNPINVIDPDGRMACEPDEDCNLFDRFIAFFSQSESRQQENTKGIFRIAIEDEVQETAVATQEVINEGTKKGLAVTKEVSDNVSTGAAIIEGAAAATTVVSGGSSSPVTGPVVVGTHAIGLIADGVGLSVSLLEVTLFDADPSELADRTSGILLNFGVTKVLDKTAGGLVSHFSKSTQATRAVKPSLGLQRTTHAAADATGVVLILNFKQGQDR